MGLLLLFYSNYMHIALKYAVVELWEWDRQTDRQTDEQTDGPFGRMDRGVLGTRPREA